MSDDSEDQRFGDQEEYEKILRHWQDIGFINTGWHIRWSEGEGSWRMTFSVGKHVYDLTEAAMDYFVVGANHMAAHVAQLGKEPKSDH